MDLKGLNWSPKSGKSPSQWAMAMPDPFMSQPSQPRCCQNVQGA